MNSEHLDSSTVLGAFVLQEVLQICVILVPSRLRAMLLLRLAGTAASESEREVTHTLRKPRAAHHCLLKKRVAGSRCLYAAQKGVVGAGASPPGQG